MNSSTYSETKADYKTVYETYCVNCNCSLGPLLKYSMNIHQKPNLKKKRFRWYHFHFNESEVALFLS